MAHRLRLSELTRDEVRELAPRATVILPASSTEQHGPHLPLGTDALLGEAVTFKAAERAAASVPLAVAPMLSYGNSHHHLFASAASLRSTTFYAVLSDLADSLVVSGFKRIFVVNAHGGNDECVKLLAKDLVLRHEVAVAACSYWQVAESAVKALVTARLGRFPGRYPGHSGWFETSMMMAIAPDLVRAAQMPLQDPDPPSFAHRGIGQGLVMQKSGEWVRIGGYSDAPVGATAEMGRAMLEATGQALGEAIVAFHRAAYE